MGTYSNKSSHIMHEYWYIGTKRNTNKYFSTYGNILCFQCTYGNKYRGNKHMGHF